MRKKQPRKLCLDFFLGKNLLQFRLKHMLVNAAETLISEMAAWWGGRQTCTRKGLNHPDQTGSRSQTVAGVISQVNYFYFFLL